LTRKKIAFVGFTYDYEHMDIDSLKLDYEIYSFYIPNRVNFFLSKILFYKPIYFKFVDIYISLCFLMAGNNFNLIITKDNLDYLPSLIKRQEKKILLFRNLYKGCFAKYLKHFDVYTFDLEDSESYGFRYYEQYASGVDYILSSEFDEKYDVAFVGQDKGREKLLFEMQSNMPDIGFDFYIVKKRALFLKVLCNIFPFMNDSLSYKEYLHRQLGAKVVLDLVQKNQSGVTMRFIEAIAAGKKIITNNSFALTHSLYNSNVYIISEPLDFNELHKFISADVSATDYLQTKKYSGRYILEKIINEQ